MPNVHKFESITSNKRINRPPTLVSKETKKTWGIGTALPLPSGEEKSQFLRNQRQRSL